MMATAIAVNIVILLITATTVPFNRYIQKLEIMLFMLAFSIAPLLANKIIERKLSEDALQSGPVQLPEQLCPIPDQCWA